MAKTYETRRINVFVDLWIIAVNICVAAYGRREWFELATKKIIILSRILLLYLIDFLYRQNESARIPNRFLFVCAWKISPGAIFIRE